MAKPLKVFVSYGYRGYANPLIESGRFEYTDDRSLADVILFAGGEDIDPRLYDEPVGSRTYFNPRRDAVEVDDFKFAVENDIPMVGVCRGMQFLTAMHGGKLVQHVSNHAGPRHPMYLADGTAIQVNSLHHQMCLPFGYIKNFELVGYAPALSGTYLNGYDQELPATENLPEPEALYYPDIKAFGVQWHPEMMPFQSEAVQWFVKAVVQYLFTKEKEHVEV